MSHSTGIATLMLGILTSQLTFAGSSNVQLILTCWFEYNGWDVKFNTGGVISENRELKSVHINNITMLLYRTGNIKVVFWKLTAL